ncbi:hypothetical protein QTL95_14310 [Rhizobium sp. S152]|uniref:hypothetical protein n=1 Tax=Rhizobium sp. S152 TaxID=3055038 RepID=UPI0025A9969D|nr:hypothetical protein [Rhizobium sp. S152]MDM9627077.1 hypothetical protein [Rhizobium sp. S152]
MTDIDDFAPELFGLWPARRAYDGGPPEALDEDKARAVAGACMLETKSAPSPAEELRVLLNEMTSEMREQFAAFRELRKAAEQTASAGGDDAAAKLARADLKAATDAMSLIVRTLEKIDQLQRQFARDREQAAEESEAARGLDHVKTRFLALIEERAETRARQLLAEWQRDGAPPADDGPAVANREAEPG